MRNPMFRIWNKSTKEWQERDFHLIGEVMLLQGFDISQLNDLEINQATGLKDNNGVEIYEGDILTDAIEPKTIRLQVTYQAPCFVKLWHDGQTTAMIDMEEWEVIGNIHENPEILLAEHE